MAPPIAIERQRGSALLESLPVVALLLVFIAGLLLAAYLLFARAWIQFESEQALYCMSVAQTESTSQCERNLARRIGQFLPWGRASIRVHGGQVQARWTVEVLWKFHGYAIQIDKKLTPAIIVRSKALHW